MPFLKLIEDHLGSIGGILASLTLISSKVRKGIAWLWSRFRAIAGGGRTEEMVALIRGMSVKVDFIESELRFNGGSSLKDMTVMLYQRQRQQFLRSQRPSVEVDGDAHVILASVSACHLFDVADPAELYVRNWLRFIDGRVDEMLLAYAATVRTGSSFSFPLLLRTIDGNPLGRWELRLSPITQPGMSRQIYSGYFRPMDEAAKAVMAGL